MALIDEVREFLKTRGGARVRRASPAADVDEHDAESSDSEAQLYRVRKTMVSWQNREQVPQAL